MFRNNATSATEIPEITTHLMKYLATEGTQDSQRHVLNALQVSHGMNAGYKLDTKRFQQRIREYLGEFGLPMLGTMMKNEAYEVPMYQLVHDMNWKQLMAMCVKYRMSHEVVHSTLDVFTLDFGILESYQMPNSKYATRSKTPDNTYRNLQACIDMVEGGFFNFVGGIMESYDRDVIVTRKCVQVLYCMSTVMEYISRNVTPYSQIVLYIGTRGIGAPTRDTYAMYRYIMTRYLNEKRPPSTILTRIDTTLLFNTMMDIHNLIPGDPDDATLETVAAECEKVVDNATENSHKMKNMNEGVIGHAIEATVKWLRLSLQSAKRTDNEHQILALRFLYQLLLQNMEEYPRIMLKHGIVEVLLLGIAKNNARANAILQGQVEDAADVMRNQFAFYDVMSFIFSSDLDFTIVVQEFCNLGAFEHVAETLQLAMNDTSIFRFEFGLQRTKLYQNVCPGVLVAPYKTRCDDITSTYNISEIAVVLACRMCQHALYGVIRKKPDAIFAYNLNKFKRLDIDGILIDRILLYGCRSFVDDDARLKVENDPCSMDRDSFRQRGVSLRHIHRLATTLGIHHKYVEMVVNRSD